MMTELFLARYEIEGELREAYLRDVPAVRHLSSFAFSRPVTFFVGENGTGKSTLLEALAVHTGLNPEGGTRNSSFATARTHSTLHQNLRFGRGIRRPRRNFFLRAESLYNVASYIDDLMDDTPLDPLRSKYAPYGGRSLHQQSHGESFFALFMHPFQGQGLFFLDEPEAALSPARQMAFLSRLHYLVRQKAQFLIATHSPILMAYPEAEIVVITEDGATITPYEETEHYTVTKSFLNATGTALRYLLEEGES